MHHFQVTTKTLIFLYSILDTITGNERKEFLSKFLKENFFELFLHWHQDTRIVFYRILVYKV